MRPATSFTILKGRLGVGNGQQGTVAHSTASCWRGWNYWHNYMTRFFSSTAHAGPIGEEELERAKARLQGVDFLIDLADFEACMEPLRERLHWNNTALDPGASIKNVHGGGARTVEMSPKAHRKLTEANQLDLALYEYFRLAWARQHQARVRVRESEGQQAPTERTQAAPTPAIEHAFYGDSVRIAVTDNPIGPYYHSPMKELLAEAHAHPLVAEGTGS